MDEPIIDAPLNLETQTQAENSSYKTSEEEAPQKNQTKISEHSKFNFINSNNSQSKNDSAYQPVRENETRLMNKIAAESPTPPAASDLVEGVVIAINRSRVYVDIPPYGTGIIYGREFLASRELIKRLEPGDPVTATVVDLDNDKGYIELSLKEARHALVWREAEELLKNKQPLELTIKEANKGGLILEWEGLIGFLPASQLKPEHYPKVEDGDKEKILAELKKLIGSRMLLTIIAASSKENKLIFSEKNTVQYEKLEKVEKYKVGDEIEGEVSGVVDFGAFVKIENELEGLVHISEMDWALVDDPRKLYSPGNKIKVKIIDTKDGKVSLSIKQLMPNPWVEAAKKYKKGDVAQGVIIKYNRHGALASIEAGVAGLVHISEFISTDELRKTLELGKSYPFLITLFEPQEQRMTLSYKAALSSLS